MERQSSALLNSLSADVQFTVIGSDGLDELPTAVRTIKMGLPRRPAVARIVWFYFRSARHVKRLRGEFDLVHSCGAVSRTNVDLSTVHLCHAAVGPGSRASLTGWRKINSALARWMGLVSERRQYRTDRVRRLIAVSESVQKQLARYYPRVERAVVANGVDVQHFATPKRRARSNGEALRAVMVTGDFSLKGVDLAMEALVNAPSVTLKVVGRGALQQYRNRVEELGIADRVTFFGELSDVRPVYSDSDVVICVSNYESFGLYLVEAALAGCAVVSTAVGVAPQLIGNNDGGLIVEHDARSLAGALVQLQLDPEFVHRCATYSAAAAREFSLDAMREAYLAHYREMADG